MSQFAPLRRRARIGRDELISDLLALGVRPGQHLLIHCSMREIGPVDGGSSTLLGAIIEVAGPMATLVVPTQTSSNSLSSRAFLAATHGLSPTELARHIAAMPGFDPASTPSAGMGTLAEHVRTRPRAVRSSHPQSSFAAIGPDAASCMSVHDLACHLGERSPLGWLYTADAAILLLGVGYSVCTAFHLAEYRQPGGAPLRSYHCFTGAGAARTALEFTDIELDDSDFGRLGSALEAATAVQKGWVGAASCRLLPLRVTVDFACAWLADHRRRRIADVRASSSFPCYPADKMAAAPMGRGGGATVPGNIDRRSPFFLSYAHAAEGVLVEPEERDPDQLVGRFFRDLKGNVAELIVLRMGVEAGFIDRTMRGGMRWTDELLHALGNCQILIALLSARYVQSKWCGMEWHAFAQRQMKKRKNAAASQGCIIPVIWAPIPDMALPHVIERELYFFPTENPDPTVPRRYQEHGLLGLLRTGQVTAYEIVVWQLARHIQSVYHSQQLMPRIYKSAEELQNIFLNDCHV